MSEVGNLIYNRRKELGLTLEEVGDAVGVSKSTVKKWENGFISNMRRDKIEKLADILQLNPIRLLGITYEKYEDGGIESKVFTYKYPKIEEIVVPIPLIGRVAAGYNCYADDNITEYIKTDRDIIKEGYAYFWLEVKGDSMEPELHEKDLVLIREQDTLEKKCFAVVTIDDEDGLVKLVDIEKNRITLNSVNPYYPPRVFEREEMNRVKLVGKVIEIKRRLE